MSDDNDNDPPLPTLAECARVVTALTISVNFLKRERLRSSMEEPLICNQQVAGSSPAVGFLTDKDEEIKILRERHHIPGVGNMVENTTNHDAVPDASSHPPQAAGANQMTDIVDRLRTWCHAPDAQSAQDLMDEAAVEIKTLRDIVRNLTVTKPMPKEISADVSSHPTSDRIYVSGQDSID